MSDDRQNNGRSDGSHTPPGQPAQPMRRVVLKAGGGLALTALVPVLAGCGQSGAPGTATANPPLPVPDDPATPPVPTPMARFLTDDELATLRAFVDRMIPPDTDPGAADAGCAEAIDAMLAAFLTDPPLIYAGAPFSDRGGAATNRFVEFLPPDAYEELAWRIAIEGSMGLAEREFNGPVTGAQTIYRDGLAALNNQAQALGFDGFAAAPAPVQDQVLRAGDAAITALVDTGFLDTLDAMYGPPEYGGNADLTGWDFTAFDGDTQPTGYADEQVINADQPGLLDFLLPPSYSETTAGKRTAPGARTAAGASAGLSMLASTEAITGTAHAAGGSLAALKRHLGTPPDTGSA